MVLREDHNCRHERETRISGSILECLLAESGGVAGHCVCTRLAREGFLRGGLADISLAVSAALSLGLPYLSPISQRTAACYPSVTSPPSNVGFAVRDYVDLL